MQNKKRYELLENGDNWVIFDFTRYRIYFSETTATELDNILSSFPYRIIEKALVDKFCNRFGDYCSSICSC